jgi:hypothetical protein
MAAQTYTDLFNTSINTLAATLNAVTGLVLHHRPTLSASALHTARRDVIHRI